MDSTPPERLAEFDARWSARRDHWARKLGRLRLGVEPLEVQLARYKRVSWVLTGVCAGIGSMFVALFSAFNRPDIGLIVVAVLLGPVMALSWLDYFRLNRRARAFLRERTGYESERKRLVQSPSQTDAASESI